MNDAATAAFEEGARPRPGDVSVCFSCAGLLVFTDEGATRAASDDEWAAAMSDPQVALLVGSLLAYIAVDG